MSDRVRQDKFRGAVAAQRTAIVDFNRSSRSDRKKDNAGALIAQRGKAM
jgi:hypothetical protein